MPRKGRCDVKSSQSVMPKANLGARRWEADHLRPVHQEVGPGFTDFRMADTFLREDLVSATVQLEAHTHVHTRIQTHAKKSLHPRAHVYAQLMMTSKEGEYVRMRSCR